MSKKRFVVRMLLLILFSPAFLAGMVYEMLAAYFLAGKDVMEALFDWFDGKLGD